MVITVSNNNEMRQYSLPNNIKSIVFSVAGFLVVFILSLFIYIYILSDRVEEIRSHNQQLSTQIKKSKLLEQKFERLQLAFEKIKQDKENLKKEYNTKLTQVKSIISKKVQLKYEAKLIADEKEAKSIEEKKRLAKKIAKEKKKRLAAEKKEKERIAKRKAEEKKKKLAAKKKKKKELLAKKKRAEKRKKAEKKKKKKLAYQKKLKSKTKILKKIAKKNLGKHYVWGATGPRTFDCSGFTSYVYKKKGIKIPRTSREQSKYGSYIKRRELKAGDLIFFDTSRRRKGIVNHVGMYIGNNKFIHASSAKKRVVITSLSKPFYASRFKWGRRIIN